MAPDHVEVARETGDVLRTSRDFNMVRGHPGALTYELRINVTKPPFDRKEVRQALHYAIDRKGIVEKVLFGISQPTVLPYSPHSAAYDKTALDKYPFDLNRAKELLGKSGATGLKAEAMVVSSYPELGAHRPGHAGRPRQDRVRPVHRGPRPDPGQPAASRR